MLDPGAQSLTDEFPTIASEELQEARRTWSKITIWILTIQLHWMSENWNSPDFGWLKVVLNLHGPDFKPWFKNRTILSRFRNITTVTHQIPDRPVFEWSFFGHFLCLVIKRSSFQMSGPKILSGR
jgi:hypothetical protein